MNTTQLDTIALNLLAKHGTAEEALPHFRRLLMKTTVLLDALALEFLEGIASRTNPGQSSPETHQERAGSATVGHSPFDAHATYADGGVAPSPLPGQTVIEIPRAGAGEPAAVGQESTETQRARAGGGESIEKTVRPKPINVKAHNRARRRTAEDREAEIAAVTKNLSAVFARPIFDKPIGMYEWHELLDLRRSLATNAMAHLMLGATAAKDAILVDKLLCYAVPDNMNAKVLDVVTEQVLISLEMAAQAQVIDKLHVSEGAATVAFVDQLEFRG
jgi:hypothetical protein